MSIGVNKVIIVGALGSDSELRYTASGSPTASISVATDEVKSGENKDRLEWHRIVIFGLLAETTKPLLRTGGQVYIEGMLHTSKWEDKNGNDKYITEIIASDVQILKEAPKVECVLTKLEDLSDIDIFNL